MKPDGDDNKWYTYRARSRLGVWLYTLLVPKKASDNDRCYDNGVKTNISRRSLQ